MYKIIESRLLKAEDCSNLPGASRLVPKVHTGTIEGHGQKFYFICIT